MRSRNLPTAAYIADPAFIELAVLCESALAFLLRFHLCASGTDWSKHCPCQACTTPGKILLPFILCCRGAISSLREQASCTPPPTLIPVNTCIARAQCSPTMSINARVGRAESIFALCAGQICAETCIPHFDLSSCLSIFWHQKKGVDKG